MGPRHCAAHRAGGLLPRAAPQRSHIACIAWKSISPSPPTVVVQCILPSSIVMLWLLRYLYRSGSSVFACLESLSRVERSQENSTCNSPKIQIKTLYGRTRSITVPYLPAAAAPVHADTRHDSEQLTTGVLDDGCVCAFLSRIFNGTPSLPRTDNRRKTKRRRKRKKKGETPIHPIPKPASFQASQRLFHFIMIDRPVTASSSQSVSPSRECKEIVKRCGPPPPLPRFFYPSVFRHAESF